MMKSTLPVGILGFVASMGAATFNNGHSDGNTGCGISYHIYGSAAGMLLHLHAMFTVGKEKSSLLSLNVVVLLEIMDIKSLLNKYSILYQAY